MAVTKPTPETTIESLWAVLVVIDGDERIVTGIGVTGDREALIAADSDNTRLKSIIEAARVIALANHKTLRLVRFSKREDRGTIEG